MREKEFQRSIRVSQSDSNASLTMRGLSPNGLAKLTRTKAKSAPETKTGRRQNRRAASAAASFIDADRAKNEAPIAASSPARTTADGPSRKLRIATVPTQPAAAPSRSTP